MEEKITKTASTEDKIFKGTYKVFNGTSYDTYYLKTSADQVEETDIRKFVSPSEKQAWTSKADSNHTHEDLATKADTFTKQEVTNFLADKAATVHGHDAIDIVSDETHRFVTDIEKTKWNDTYSKEHINSLETEIKGSIKTLTDNNTADHAAIRKEFAAADTVINGKVTTVQGNLDEAVKDLTEIINNGGTANTELAKKVENIEKTELPGIKTSVTTLDNKYIGITNELATNKADKTALAAEVSTIQGKLDLKANTTDLSTGLATKADKNTVYTKSETDGKLDLKVNKSTYDTDMKDKASLSYVNTELSKKVNSTQYTTDMAKKANITDVEESLELKANIVHTHESADITGLGTAATRDIGISAGNIPLLNAQGKLADSVLPALAINEKFTANTVEEAMTLIMQIGDILILGNSAQRAAIDASTGSSGIVYESGEPKSSKTTSDEYTKYIASGKLTYLCIDPSDDTFEGRFRPLQATSDTMSRGEIEAELIKKLDKTTFETFKTSNTAALNLKANANDVFTKTEVNSSLSTKVDKVEGKVLSSNDFTNEQVSKLAGIEEGANNYIHPDLDGAKHVPATGNGSNGKALIAGSSAGSMTWTRLNAGHIEATSERLWLTPGQVSRWDSKAEGNHHHNDIYRTLADSYSRTETDNIIGKMKTVAASTAPSAGTQLPGAVWIEIPVE